MGLNLWRKTTPRMKFGAIISAIWIAAALICAVWDWHELLTLKPNELGDMFAGFAAPLAFLWLVLGYLQQGEELRLQRTELALQREQLGLQKEETKRIADETAKQATAIQANELHARRDTFMKVSELIVDDQRELASSMLSAMAIFDAPTKGRFDAGEKNVVFSAFVRQAANDEFRMRFVERFKKDLYFDHFKNRFCENFDRLILLASDCDPDGTLRTVFENSRMASMYAAICLLGKREINFTVRAKPGGIGEIK
jgi:hypothetical protein